MRTRHVPHRPAVLAAVAGVVVAAGCTGDPEDKPGPASAAALPSQPPTEVPESPSDGSLSQEGSEASAPQGPISPADDADMRDLIGSFEPVIEGFEFNDPIGAPAYDTVFNLWNPVNVEITPGACKPVEAAIELATDADRTDAARDLVQPNGLYLEPEEVPYNGGDIEGPTVHVMTRIFGDETRAASLATGAVAAECDAYEVTYGGEGFGYRRGRVEVAMTELPGVVGPVVRIEVDDDVTWHTEPDGELIEQDAVNGVGFVYVNGPFAIRVMTTEVTDPEAIASGVIADFVAHASQ